MKSSWFRHFRRGLLVIVVAGSGAVAAGAAGAEVVRGYWHRLEPREHPDYDRRAVRPPDWGTFGERTRFTTLRGFGVEGSRIVGYAEELERYTRKHDLGEVIWPSYPILFATNLVEFADEIRRRDLYLFDVWGYVPGSGPGGYWQQFRPPREAFEVLESRLGERWLGTDVGEQDGRYIGGYANQMSPASADRRAQHLNFQRHFERMGDDLGHRHATLVSLNFGHYFLKEGTYTLIGAETAQALPNNQVYYAFIRGAGKQYGVPWFGNASIFNRWGYKVYGSSGRSDGYDFGPTKGTSLGLLKRLLYSHILYNAVAVGFENGWLEGDQLTPIGRIQQSAHRWVRENGSPGTMHTPIALLLDFHAGWSFPRHLYSGDVYRVWGNLPYGPGDHLTDAILDLLYPGYADSSFFHDESGFLTPTPYGDMADCVLSDAPLWLLQRYPVVVVAGELAGGREIRDRLRAYAEGGGHVVITRGNLERLTGGLTDGPAASAEAGAVVEQAVGRGRVTWFASPYGVEPVAGAPAPRSEVDRPMARPYRMVPEVRGRLEEIFRRQALFTVQGEGLSLITCRRGPGDYVVGVANATLRPQPFALAFRCGEILERRELGIDVSEQGAPGQVPEGMDPAGVGRNGEGVIAGGDVRVFAVRVRESGVEEIPHERPPGRPRGRLLALTREPVSLREEILGRPTFFEHWDGLVVPGRHLAGREAAVLRAEAGWLRRQGVRVVVDLSGAINLYPGLRLIDNLPADYAASLATVRDVLAKMKILGARDLILSLHRHPENNFDGQQTEKAFTETLQTLAREAGAAGITLHLRVGYGKPPWNPEEGLAWVDRIGSANLKLALSTGLLASRAKAPSAELAGKLRGRVGVWLIAGFRTDLAGKVWDVNAPLHDAPSDQRTAVESWMAAAPEALGVAEGTLENADAEYLEARALETMRTGRVTAGSAPSGSVPAWESVEASGLHNVFRMTPRVYSGSSPEGDAAFAALAGLGVKTIVSVDGAKPDVEGARRHGMRYVHLPHGYDGVGEAVERTLVQASRTLPGPVYVHCHHGKHRGPAAAAVLCLATEGWTRDTAEAYLRSAGTSTNYPGLYRSIRGFRPPTAAELASLPAELPETAPVPGLVEAMVGVDLHWERLQAVRRAGYRRPADDPDAQPANQALILREQYREVRRLPEAAGRGREFLDAMEGAESEVQVMEQLLRGIGGEPPGTELRELLDRAFDVVGRRCGACHRKHRDGGSG